MELPVDCDIYMSPNQNALSLRAVKLKNVVSLRHISVRSTIIHSITALHKERVGWATSNWLTDWLNDKLSYLLTDWTDN